jgi:hypothetical protein
MTLPSSTSVVIFFSTDTGLPKTYKVIPVKAMLAHGSIN